MTIAHFKNAKRRGFPVVLRLLVDFWLTFGWPLHISKMQNAADSPAFCVFWLTFGWLLVDHCTFQKCKRPGESLKTTQKAGEVYSWLDDVDVSNPYPYRNVFTNAWIILTNFYALLWKMTHTSIDNTKLLLRTVDPTLQQRLLVKEGLNQKTVSKLLSN